MRRNALRASIDPPSTTYARLSQPHHTNFKVIKMSWFQISICSSELAAIFLIFKLWKSNEFLIFKICFSIIAIVPFLGPFFVLWGSNFPKPQHLAFQDRQRFGADVFDRWRHVLSEKNKLTKFRMWQATLEKKHKNEL